MPLENQDCRMCTKFPMINKKWTLSDASYAQCLTLQKKPIVDQLLKDLSESKDKF